MNILNKSNIPSISLGKLSYINDSIHLNQLNFDGIHQPIWYVEIRDIHGFTDECLDLILPSQILSLIQNKEVTLIICNSYEGFHSIIECIYTKLILERNIPESHIQLYTGSRDILFTINNISKSFNKDPIKAFWIRISEYLVARSEVNNPTTVNKFFSEKKFINLNRRWRPHRPSFVGLLYSKNLLQYGYVSLIENFENYNWENMYDYVLSLNKSNDLTYALLNENKKQIINLKKLVVDIEDLNFNTAKLSPNLIPYYNETFFSVVSEVNFYRTYPLESGICLTEKTFKPMVYRHPFLMLSVPKTLETLKDIGYKTFSPFIDEKYDLEYNDASRILMVLKEVERLCKFSQKELIDFSKEIKPICDYNYKILCSRYKNFSVTMPLN